MTTDMFKNSAGSIRPDCLKCLTGEYRVDEDTCDLCPSGTYAKQPTSGSSGAVKCTACTNSSHITSMGSDSEDDCRPACSSGLLLAPTEDKQSVFCNASCPSWTRADSNGVTCNSICEAGSFAMRSTCRACRVGYHQSVANQTRCEACRAGRYSSEEGATSCVNCVNATYSLPASHECLIVSLNLVYVTLLLLHSAVA